MLKRKPPKPRECTVCRKVYQPINSRQIACDMKCALLKVQAKNKLKVKAYTRKTQKANTKAVRDLNKRTLSWQHKKTQPVFNRMRVLEEIKWFRDLGREPECISCGKTNMDWACGHYQSVGSTTGTMRYDVLNTYLQCNKRCNMSLSGNISGTTTTRGYENGPRERFGEDQAQSIMEYCKVSQQPKKWQCEDLEEARAGYAERIRELTLELE
jgi:hypothetical protein